MARPSLVYSRNMWPTTNRGFGEGVRFRMKVKAILDGIVDLLGFAAGGVIAFITLLICATVFIRYLAGGAIKWALPVSELCLLFIAFLGTTWVLKREGHVKMDLVLDQLKPRNQAMLNIVTSAIATISCLVITWYSTQATWNNFQGGVLVAKLTEVNKFIPMAVIPLGSFLLSIQFMRRTYGYFRSWRQSPSREQSPL